MTDFANSYVITEDSMIAGSLLVKGGVVASHNTDAAYFRITANSGQGAASAATTVDPQTWIG